MRAELVRMIFEEKVAPTYHLYSLSLAAWVAVLVVLEAIVESGWIARLFVPHDRVPKYLDQAQHKDAMVRAEEERVAKLAASSEEVVRVDAVRRVFGVPFFGCCP